MSNKTCCQCRYMLHKDTFEVCTRIMANTAMFNEACKHFKPKVITNGDVIKQGNNRKLAEIFDDLYNGNKCKYCIHHAGSDVCKLNPTPRAEYDEGYLDDEDCLNGFEAWLNAPAEINTEREE